MALSQEHWLALGKRAASTVKQNTLSLRDSTQGVGRLSYAISVKHAPLSNITCWVTAMWLVYSQY